VRKHEQLDELASIAYGLDALQTMRAYGKCLYDAYVERLTHATRQTATPPEPSDDGRAYPYDSRAKAKLHDLVKWIQRWPHYRTQEKALRQIDHSEGVLVVAIASSRLHNAAIPSPRKQLGTLSKGLVGPGIETDIAAAGAVLMFEPAFESASWNDKSICHGEGVFIIDTGFLLYMLLRSPVASAATTIQTMLKLTAVRKRWPEVTRRTLLIAALIGCAYRLLLSGIGNLEAVLFTSNSHATEVLRVHLIQSPNCTRITEILHGVPTVEVEQYFEQILQLDNGDGGSHKHFFIEQIPGLICEGVVARRKRTGTAINPYLNRYFSANLSTRSARREFIRRELDSLGLRDDQVILTFGGGMAVHRRSYFGSQAFKAECQLMTEMTSHLRMRKEPFQLLYAVHPLFLPEELERCTFFRNHDVTVCRSTVFTWLVSDFFASLLSSSMFEAAYFGAKAFAPMTLADGYYSPHLLRLLSHPAGEDRESLTTAVADFLRRVEPGPPASDLLKRAEDRLQRMQTAFVPPITKGERG